MRFNLNYRFLFFSLLELISSNIVLAWGGWDEISKANERKRRDVELTGLQSMSFSRGLKVRADLKKRQDPTCKCLAITPTFYPIATRLGYMAAPFQECDVQRATSKLCPTDYICACQNNQTSICLPTTIQSTTACGLSNIDPSLRILPSTTRWFFDSVPTNLAASSGQCGGFTQASATTFWATSMTLCPVGQVCACQNSGYSRCIDTADPAYRGTSCPDPCATVRQEFRVSLPPPSATAKLRGQCGGKCWTGPTNCPIGASCFTETSPIPGAYAECATANPGSQLKIREEGYGIVIPAKARAIATRIYY